MAKYLGVPPESKPEGRQFVLYGAPYSGKTTSLADPDIQVLLADMDHNTSPLEDADNVTIYPIDTFEDYLEFKASIARGYFIIDKKRIPVPYFDLLAFDSFTRFEELLKSWVRRVFAPNRKREISDKFGAQSDWQDLQDKEVEEVRYWQQQTREKGFNVFWIGHDMTLFENPNAETLATSIRLALQGKYAAPRIMGAVDGIMYFVKETILVDPKDRTKGSKVRRGVYTQQFGITQADVRLSVTKREKLPPFVEAPKWSKLLPYMGYKKALTTTDSDEK